MPDNARIAYNPMPGCCVGVVLHSFGGSRNRSFEGEQADKNDMLKQIQIIARKEHNGGYKLNQLGVVVATLTTEQTTAIEALKTIGFKVSDPYKKAKHPESDLLVFTMAAPELKAWADRWVEPPKREMVNLNKNPKPKTNPVPPVAPVAWDEDFEEEDI